MTEEPAVRRALAAFLLAMIVVVGFGLRVFNIDWDQGHHLHPDERHISNVSGAISWPESYFDTSNSSLNPHNHVPSFVYGTLPLFMNKAFSGWLSGEDSGTTVRHAIDAVGIDIEDDNGEPRFDDGYGSYLTGRLLAAIFDVGTVLLVFAMARRLFGTGIGLLSSFFVGITVLHIQHAHFFVNESFLVFFTTAVLFFSIRIAQRASRWDLLGAGVALGAAMATKISAAPIALVVVAACLFGLRTAVDGSGSTNGSLRSTVSRFLPAVGSMVGIAAIAFLVFRIANPYAFSGPGFFGIEPSERFVTDMRGQFALQNGGDWPPNYQWVGRIGPLFLLQNLVLWGLGIPLSIAAGVGLWRATVQIRRRWFKPQVLLVAWVVLLFVLVSRNFVLTMRYLLPLYPLLAILAASGVAWLYGKGRLKAATGARSGSVLTSVAILLVALSVGWTVAFVSGVYGQENTRISASRWIYENVPAGSLLMTEEWDDALPLTLAENLPDEYEYVTFPAYQADTKEKVIGLVDMLDDVNFIVRSSDRASGSVPRIPARFPSTSTYYEALETGELGFERVATFERGFSLGGIEISDNSAEEAFNVYDHAEVAIYEKTSSYTRAQTLDVLRPERAGAAISIPPITGSKNGSQLRPDEYIAQQEGGTWNEVFSGTPFGGQLAWLWWLLWLELASIAVLPWTTRLLRALPDAGFGLAKVIGLTAVTIPLWLAISAGLISLNRWTAWAALGGSLLVGFSLGWKRRDELIAMAQMRWPRWLAVEIVFLLFFFGFLLLKAFNPDLWHFARGGEKPMELAYFSAIARSTTLPPLDPWFAGGVLNYYYVGWFFLAVPVRALGIAPEVAFNLGIPTVAALAAAAAFSNVGNLAALCRASVQRSSTKAYIYAGSLGASLLLLFGNLDALKQLIQMLIGDREFGVFDWWASSRAYVGNLDVTEFPFWSLLFGDLHPHVMAIPFLGLVLGIAIAYLAAVGTNSSLRGIALSLGVATALTRLVHTWDLPLAVLLSLIVIGSGRFLYDSSETIGRVRASMLDLGAFVVGHLVVSAPVLLRQEVFYNELTDPTQETPISGWLIHFGLFLVVGAVYAVLRARESNGLWTNRRMLARSRFVLLGLAAAVAFGIAVGAGWPVVAITTLFVAILTALLMRDIETDKDPSHLLAITLAVIALAVAASIDVVVVANDVERMNTAFKFLYQSWHLLAIFSAFALWWIGSRLNAPEQDGGRSRTLWWWGASGLVAVGLLFAVVGAPARLDDRFSPLPPTLNGLAYLEVGPRIADEGGTIDIAADLPLIKWLRDNIEGSPTVVETTGNLYSWASRISINTGLPTILGWDWHQTQQRLPYDFEIQERSEETKRFYDGTDEVAAADFLLRYDAAYVVIGTLERARHAPEGLAMLEEMPGLVPVFRSGDGVILEVDPQALEETVRRSL